MARRDPTGSSRYLRFRRALGVLPWSVYLGDPRPVEAQRDLAEGRRRSTGVDGPRISRLAAGVGVGHERRPAALVSPVFRGLSAAPVVSPSAGLNPAFEAEPVSSVDGLLAALSALEAIR